VIDIAKRIVRATNEFFQPLDGDLNIIIEETPPRVIAPEGL